MSPLFDPRAFALMQLARSFYEGNPQLLAIDQGYRYDQDGPTEDVVIRVHFLGLGPGDVQKPPGGEELELMFFGTEGQVHRKYQEPWCRPQRRLMPGLSIGFKNPCSLGLIGVDKKDNNRPALLTCRHLFGPNPKPNAKVFQPAPRHQRGQSRQQILRTAIGRLNRISTSVDAAVVHLNGRRRASNRLFTGSQQRRLEITRLRSAKLGEILVKSGCRTGVTKARVDGVGLLFTGVDQEPQRVFRLVPVPTTTGSNREISAPGDSGAIWMDPEGSAGVGLHIRGELDPKKSNEYAFALDLELVCDEIGFELMQNVT